MINEGEEHKEIMTKDSQQIKMDSLFAEWDKPDSPGAAVVIIKDASIVYKRGYGMANLEYDIPITPSTVFDIASVSKQFTAMSILMLAHQGKLSLDDDIRQHLPDAPDFGKTITIRHLIHHTNGIRDWVQSLVIAGLRMDDVITFEHILKMFRRQKELNFEPGEEYLYSNTGYNLLAQIVTKVTGKTFRQYTAEQIFKPLGMTNSHFHDDHQMMVKNRAYSYAPAENGGFKSVANNLTAFGSSSLYTTAEDLAQWMLNFEHGRVELTKVGGADVIEQMSQQGVLNNGEQISYAFGQSIGKYKGLNTVEHGGSWAGFRSVLLRFPEQKFAIAILSNLSAFKPADIARKIADIYLANQITPEASKTEPAKRTIADVDTRVYDDYIGAYQLRPGSVITITKENDRLMGQRTNQPEAELFPESETTFFMQDIDVEISFQRDESGTVTQLTVHQNGKDFPANRINLTPLKAHQLAEFCGDYYTCELDTTYTIIVREGRLMAQHRRHDDIPLTQVGEYFVGEEWFFALVEFTRDEQHRVNGFRLSGERVRNLRFDKQVHVI